MKIAGYYCPPGSIQGDEVECDAGYYCPGASPNQKLCESGFYQPNNASDSCLPCDAGIIFCKLQLKRV